MVNTEAVIKDFNKKFKTSFDMTQVNSALTVLNLPSPPSLSSLLLSLVFLYFEKQNFRFTREIEVGTLDDNIINIVTLSFKKSFMYNGADFVIWIKNKFKEGYDETGDSVNFCEKNDICIADKKKNRFYCVSEAMRNKLSEKLMAENIVITYEIPKDVTGNLLKKLLSYKHLDIHEIELVNITEPDLSDFYLKAGSKKTKINTKVKIIVDKLIKNLRPFNVKSILVGCKRIDPYERIRISLKPENFTSYRLEIQTKTPDLTLKKEIEDLLQKENIEFSKSIRFTDEPIDEKVISLVNKRKVNGLANFRKEIEKWDKNSLLRFEKNRICVREDSILEVVKRLAEGSFDLDLISFKMEGVSIKGFLLTRKSDHEKILFLLNRGKKIDHNRIKALSITKRIPFFFVSTKTKLSEYRQEIVFTELNDKTKEDFRNFINDLLANPQIYTTLRSNFLSSLTDLRQIRRKLSRIKLSKKKGEVWERVCIGILDYVFKETVPLSNSYLPDGISFFQGQDSILWDAKGLKDTSLFQSTNKRGKVKDSFYIKAFKNKKFSFDYYAYISVGVTKEDFNRVQTKALQELQDLGIHNVKIICLTDKWLLSLAEMFNSSEDALRFHKNLGAFSTILKEEFNNSYLDNLDSTKFNSIGKPSQIDETSLRKEVKKAFPKK